MNSIRGSRLTSRFFFRPNRLNTLPSSSLCTPQLCKHNYSLQLQDLTFFSPLKMWREEKLFSFTCCSKSSPPGFEHILEINTHYPWTNQGTGFKALYLGVRLKFFGLWVSGLRLLTSVAFCSSFAQSMILSCFSSLASLCFSFSSPSLSDAQGGLLQELMTQNQKFRIDVFFAISYIKISCWHRELTFNLELLDWLVCALTLSTWWSSSAHSRISFLLSSRLRSVRRSELRALFLEVPSSGSPLPC